ncbi:MAG: heme lyase CcmF/NrfE family subunit [Asticcacaulis sp.]
MIAELGAFCLALALILALAQTGLSAAGRILRQPILCRAGEGASVAGFVAVLLAFVALTMAFVVSDFSVSNVAENSHTLKPLFYKISGVWGNHEGSLLLWCLSLTGFGALVAVLGRNLPADLRASVVATQGALGVMFLSFALFASNPFLRLDPAPIDGRSLNPLLQDPALAIHPPLLYLGYVGLSVVFSFAVAALIEGRVDQAWARWVRPWTLASWSFLTLGIMLGAFWAYYELGWGGWWFWDPVENASFMPWLAATALLHSAIVTEKRGALPGWTVFLALSAFSFSMLGAFLVRSGVLTSVHAFAVDPERGVLLLGILGLAAGAGFALFAWRAPSLKRGGLFAPVSRESTLVLNNIFLTVALATVVLGTLWPLLVEAATGKAVSVGPAYFGYTHNPIMAACLLLVPIGPMLAWKRGDLKGVIQRLTFAALLSLGVAGLTLAVMTPRHVVAALGVALGGWLVLATMADLRERIRLFSAPLAESLRRARALPPGTWGMVLAHIGLGVFVLGAVFETTWKQEQAAILRPGEGLSVAGYSLTLKAVGSVDGTNYLAERAQIEVVGPEGRPFCSATPERRLYPAGGQTTSEVALCMKPISDLYLVLGERRPHPGGGEGWLVRAYWNPWARLIFLGPLLMALGGAVSLADRRLRVATGAKRDKRQNAASQEHAA